MTQRKSDFFKPQRLYKEIQRPKPPHIFFTVLTGKERHNWVHPQLSVEMVRTAFRAAQGHLQMSYHPTHNIHPVSAARNSFIDDIFMKTDADICVMFDNDIAPAENIVDMALTMPPECDIAIAPYWVWTNMKPLMCFGQWENGRMITQSLPTRGWHEGGAGGTGAMMIRRRVFEEGKITRPFFKIIYDDYEGQRVSEDIYFTSKAREAGYRIFTHTDYICSHYRSMDLAEINISIASTCHHYADLVKRAYGDHGIVVPGINEMFTSEAKVERGVWLHDDGIVTCPDCKQLWKDGEAPACKCEATLAAK